MAAQKKQKGELIAIYRLEFYKKQKNWKLSTDARKEKEQQKSYLSGSLKNTNIFNETYCIETNVDNEASSLNDAFLKDGTENVLGSPLSHKSLHTQSLEPVNTCEECQLPNCKVQNPWADYVDDDWTGGADIVDKCSGDRNEYDDWVDGMVWTNSGNPQPGWIGDAAATLNSLQGAEIPGQLVWATNNMLDHQLEPLHQLTPWPDDQMWVPDTWSEGDLFVESIESVEEFMIGAHVAPHSSEMELCVPSELEGDELNMTGGSVSRMSEAALSAAVQHHTGTLRQLLREADHRRRNRSTLSLEVCAPGPFGLNARNLCKTDYSYDVFPTRDTHSTPLPSVYLYKDQLIPVLSPNMCSDRQTSTAGTNLCKDGLAPDPTILNKDVFTVPSPKNFCSDAFTKLPPINQCEEEFSSSSPSNQCRKEYIAFPPTNLHRDGFLAGSHRNKVPLGFIGRGRGRL